MTEDVFQNGKLAVLDPAEYWDEIQSLQERDAMMTDRIEKLEAAIDDLLQYVSRADWHYLKPETIKAMEDGAHD